MAKTVVGLFEKFDNATQVVSDLVASGIERENISMVTSEANHAQAGGSPGEMMNAESAARGAGIGAVAGGIGGLLVGLGSLAIPGVGPVLAAGPLVAALTGAGVGAVTGGMVGALTDAGVSKEEADIYAEGVRRGGTLITVYANDEQANAVADVMNRYQPVDIQRRAENWKHGNWNTFDEGAEPFAFDRTRTANDRLKRETPGEPAGGISETQLYGDMESGALPYSDEQPGKAPLNRTSDPSQEGYLAGEPRFRQHFNQHYQAHGEDSDTFSESYRFGFDQARHSRFQNESWKNVKLELRRIWEASHQEQNWQDYEEAVNEGWLAGKEK